MGIDTGNRKSVALVVIASLAIMAFMAFVGTNLARLIGANLREKGLQGPAAPSFPFEEAVAGSPAVVERGKQVYSLNCSACHGPEGRGDGPSASGLQPPPRDFVAPAADWTRGPDEWQMWETLEIGIPGTGMSSFTHLPWQDRLAVIHYLESLFPQGMDYEKFTPEQRTEIQAEAGGAAESREAEWEVPPETVMSRMAREALPNARDSTGPRVAFPTNHFWIVAPGRNLVPLETPGMRSDSAIRFYPGYLPRKQPLAEGQTRRGGGLGPPGVDDSGQAAGSRAEKGGDPVR